MRRDEAVDRGVRSAADRIAEEEDESSADAPWVNRPTHRALESAIRIITFSLDRLP